MLKKRFRVVQGQMEKMEKDEKKKLKAANINGYQDYVNRVAKEYKRSAMGMVNEVLTSMIPTAFRMGYVARAIAVATIMQMEPGQELMDRLVQLQMPKLEFLYTTEQCEPLPPEDDDEDDEEEVVVTEHQDTVVEADVQNPKMEIDA